MHYNALAASYLPFLYLIYTLDDRYKYMVIRHTYSVIIINLIKMGLKTYTPSLIYSIKT